MLPPLAVPELIHDPDGTTEARLHVPREHPWECLGLLAVRTDDICIQVLQLRGEVIARGLRGAEKEHRDPADGFSWQHRHRPRCSATRQLYCRGRSIAFGRL